MLDLITSVSRDEFDSDSGELLTDLRLAQLVERWTVKVFKVIHRSSDLLFYAVQGSVSQCLFLGCQGTSEAVAQPCH